MTFRYTSTIHYDELDAMNILHNARYAVHIERATVAFFHTFGPKWDPDVSRNPDQFHAVREFHIEFLRPVDGVGEIVVEIGVERLGSSSCVYAFAVLDPTGQVRYAQGHRAVIKLDPATMRPTPWSEQFRLHHQTIEARTGT